MNAAEMIREFEGIMNRKILSLPPKIRPWTTEYSPSKRLPKNMILTGLRGCGKSTFLLHHSIQSKKKMLYFSADNPMLAAESLYDAAKAIFLKGYEGVIIDEVHFARDWSRNLKSLYDDFPDRTVWASDSSSLILRAGTADLSRRYVFVQMPFMSFREFLFLEAGLSLAPANPFKDKQKIPLKPDAKILSLFEEYKDHGTRPFYQEGNYEERALATLEKTLNSDVVFFVPTITQDNLRLMSAVVGTLAAAAIPRVQVNSLCADWGISADKLYQLLEVMEAVGAARIIRFQNDSKAKSAGAKMFLADPCLYSVLRGNTGSKREAFVSGILSQAGYDVSASRNEKECDFVISKKTGGLQLRTSPQIKIEVGGRDKERKKADWTIRDNIDYPADKIIPLWLLAMMW